MTSRGVTSGCDVSRRNLLNNETIPSATAQGPARVRRRSAAPLRVFSRSNVPELSNSIIQKGLTLARDWSGTVVHSGIKDA